MLKSRLITVEMFEILSENDHFPYTSNFLLLRKYFIFIAKWRASVARENNSY